MTQAMRRLVLRADAIPLALFGIFGLLMDLLGYFAGTGAWQTLFLDNPLAIGVVEAHGLAIILACLMLFYSAAPDTRLWHGTAVAIHLLLGVCNVIFWQAFLAVDGVPLGIVATAYHFTFVMANGVALVLPRLEVKTV